MTTAMGIDRRRFFQLIGGGIVVFLCVDASTADPAASAHADPVYPTDFNAYLAISRNGRITVFSGKIEMGQGVMTSLAQMVGEELDVGIGSIDMVLGDTARCPVDMGTFGSLTTRVFGPALRAAAAMARLCLLDLAAARLRVPVAQLTINDGVISIIGHAVRRLSYGDLSRGERIVRVVDRTAVLKAATEFRLMGTSPHRLDGVAKVTGGAQYAADIRVPGMLYARILRPPSHAATRTALDTTLAERIPGIVLVNRNDLVAVLHTDPEVADAAMAAIRCRWTAKASDLGPDTIYAHLTAGAEPMKTLALSGDVGSARSTATQVFEATYEKGYVAHAPIEPHAALADINDGLATVWASTQTPFPTRDQVAAAIGLENAKVRVITPLLGGGFGGKSASAQAVEAARLAQITGKPVQVAWTRSEEFFFDRFDPASVAQVASGFGPGARIAFFDYSVNAAGDRGAALCYDVPNLRIRSTGSMSHGEEAAKESLHPFAVGPWRGPGANMNVFAIESQIDTMAAAAKQDALAFRLRHLTDQRMRRVLMAAAEAFKWTPAVTPSRRGFGVACNIDAGTYVATMAEVRVDAGSGHVQVVRVVCAQDMGVVVNPDGARMQIEGGITMGLGYALSEELRFRGGDILDRNFDTYEIPRFSWVPQIQCIFIENDELAPQGGGEPPITTTGAVIANAVFDATGLRLLRLPMTAARIKAAMQAHVVQRTDDGSSAS
jgi:isoquinoline 1-oxidoreductase